MGIGPAGRQLIEHLVRCESCRQRVLVEVEGTEAEGTEGAAWVPVGLTRTVRRALEKAARETCGEEARAEASYRELSEPAEGGAWDALSRMGADWNPALALRLLPDELAAGGEPDLAETRAELVLTIGAALDGEREAGSGCECAGRAWSALGEVARLRGELDRAEVMFSAAAHALDPTDLNARERALFCRLLARLRVDQGRTDEALGVLDRAAELYCDLGLFTRLGETLAEKGWLLLEEEEVEGAALAFRAAANVIEPVESLWASLRARQGLALCAAARGRLLEALKGWARNADWRLMGGALSERDQLRLTVLYAELAEQCGRADRAARLLRAAAEGLARCGELYDGAAAAAGLLRLLAEAGKGQAGEGLREKLAPLARDRAPWTVLSYLFDLAARFEGRAATGEAGEVFRAGGDYLDRARHNPALAQHPRWRPSAVLSWDGMTESLRQEACRFALVGGEVAGRRAYELEPGLRCRLSWAYEAHTEIRILFLGAGEPVAGGEPVRPEESGPAGRLVR
jgi:hypothetical protein